MHTSIVVEYLTSVASFIAALVQLRTAYDRQILNSRSAKGTALLHLSVQRMLFHVVPAVHAAASLVEINIGFEFKST